MEKYKAISKQEYEDKMYKLIEDYNLTDTEKEEVDILISRYSDILQKINENIEKNKYENIKKYILESLNKE